MISIPTVHITPYYSLYRRSSHRKKRYKKRRQKRPSQNTFSQVPELPHEEPRDEGSLSNVLHVEHLKKEVHDSQHPGDYSIDIESPELPKATLNEAKSTIASTTDQPKAEHVGAQFHDVFRDILYSFLSVIPKQFNYYRIHLLCFLIGSLFFGMILFAIENGPCSSGLNLLDALYLSTSSLTVTGLSTTNLAQLCWASQFVLWLEMILGGLVLATLPLVAVRRHYYRSYVRGVVKAHSATSTKSVTELLSQQGLLEYHALRKIIQVVLCYFLAVNILGFLILYFYFLANPALVETDTNNSILWLAAFHTIAAFSNAGLSIFPDSLFRFRNNSVVLLTLGCLVFCGHVGFPIMLRGIIKTLSVMYNWTHSARPPTASTPLLYGNRTPKSSHKSPRQVYDFLLMFPRNCYTHLFPPFETKFLLVVVLFLMLSEFTLFLILDWNSASFRGRSAAGKFLMSFFQSISTRTAGFTVLDLAVSAPAMWVLEMAYMYTAAYPVAVTVRQSNKQVETSVFPLKPSLETSSPQTRVRGITQSLLLRDVFWLFVAFFCISIAEKTKIHGDPLEFSMFKILFEIVSAYGNVGFSLGYIGTVTSFSTQWNPFSKVVLMLVMLLGRQRGLPENIDKAVELPKQFLQSHV